MCACTNMTTVKIKVMSCAINLNSLQAVLMLTQLSWSSQTDLAFHAREGIGGFSEQKVPLTNFLLFLWQGKSFQKQSGNTKIYRWNAKVRVAVKWFKMNCSTAKHLWNGSQKRKRPYCINISLGMIASSSDSYKEPLGIYAFWYLICWEYFSAVC